MLLTLKGHFVKMTYLQKFSSFLVKFQSQVKCYLVKLFSNLLKFWILCQEDLQRLKFPSQKMRIGYFILVFHIFFSRQKGNAYFSEENNSSSSRALLPNLLKQEKDFIKNPRAGVEKRKEYKKYKNYVATTSPILCKERMLCICNL